jgi:GT2 family glycosyltransferase
MKTSLILLAYNQADYVAQAVASVLAQDGPPLDIMLTDDCSTDGTYQIMQAMAADYRGPHRLTLRQNDLNLGFIAHLRKAISLSTGEVIVIAWGDDIAMPDRARSITQVFETTQAWLVHSHAVCIDLDGKEIPPTYLGADLLTGADLPTIATSSALFLGATAGYHRKLFQKYGHITNPHAYEDLVFGFRAALEGGVGFIDRPLVRYRVGSGISTSHMLADANGKRRAAVRLLKTQYAVLSQRRRDALIFGLLPADPIVQAINKRRLRALLQLHFWGAINADRCRRWLILHPVLALDARRRVRRAKRALAQPELAATGGASTLPA